MTSRNKTLPPAERMSIYDSRWTDEMLILDTSAAEIGTPTVWDVLRECGLEYEARRELREDAENDLLIYCAFHHEQVSIGAYEETRPYFYFSRSIVDRWLDAGGREWIASKASQLGRAK